MKRIVLLIVPALICGVMFLFLSSCSDNSKIIEQEEVDLLFTGDDIKSYHDNRRNHI